MMRFIFLFLLTTSSLFANDLENGDRARFNYESTSVYKILSAQPILTSEGPEYFSGKLKIEALVEGNICLNNRRSLGTFEMGRGDRTIISFLVRHLKTNDNVMCAEYSKETEVSATIKLFLEKGEVKVFEMDGNTITLQEENGQWQAAIVNQENVR